MFLILSCAIITSAMVYVSYSRVYIEGCHTIQQVIVGGVLGVLTGFLMFYYENDIIRLFA